MTTNKIHSGSLIQYSSTTNFSFLLTCVVPDRLLHQGKPSRSLQAAYKLLVESDLKTDDVVHLERGLYGWYQEELPIVGEPRKSSNCVFSGYLAGGCPTWTLIAAGIGR